jgi:hypothetical protein
LGTGIPLVSIHPPPLFHFADAATRSTIMTSNRPTEDWGKLLQDVPTASAILDRFLHHATVIPITGQSYRLKDAATKRQGLRKEETKPKPQA